MEIPSLSFTLPFYRQIHETLRTDEHTRITFIAIGAIGILSGIFVMTPIGGWDYLKLFRGIVLFGLGGALTMYCFKEKRNQKIEVSTPSPTPISSLDMLREDLNETQKNLLLVFEAICKDELYQQHNDAEHIIACKNYIIRMERQIEENPLPYLEVANCFQGYFDTVSKSQIPETLSEVPKTLEEIYSELGRIFIACRMIYTFEYEISERLLCAVIKKNIDQDYLYVHSILSSFPEEYKEKWQHWELHESLAKKYLKLNSYRTASIVAGWMPPSSRQAKLDLEIEKKKLELSGKNPSLVSPFKKAPPRNDCRGDHSPKRRLFE